MKTINVNVMSLSSVNDAITAIRKEQEEIRAKCELFVRRLADIGATNIKAKIDGISPFYKGDDMKVTVEQTGIGDLYTASVILSGEKCLFIEFGAGVTFSGTSHPEAAEFGYGAGTYEPRAPRQNPNYDNWENPYGYWFTDEWGASQHTYGNPAYAPVHSAADAIRLSITALAKEVFG